MQTFFIVFAGSSASIIASVGPVRLLFIFHGIELRPKTRDGNKTCTTYAVMVTSSLPSLVLATLSPRREEMKQNRDERKAKRLSHCPFFVFSAEKWAKGSYTIAKREGTATTANCASKRRSLDACLRLTCLLHSLSLSHTHTVYRHCACSGLAQPHQIRNILHPKIIHQSGSLDEVRQNRN